MLGKIFLLIGCISNPSGQNQGFLERPIMHIASYSSALRLLGLNQSLVDLTLPPKTVTVAKRVLRVK